MYVMTYVSCPRCRGLCDERNFNSFSLTCMKEEEVNVLPFKRMRTKSSSSMSLLKIQLQSLLINEVKRVKGVAKMAWQ